MYKSIIKILTFNWAGSSVVVMFGSHPKGRGFKSRPVQKIVLIQMLATFYAQFLVIVDQNTMNFSK